MTITSETFEEAFIARESELREVIAKWLSENGWKLRDLQSDSFMMRQKNAANHADSLMAELNRIRLEYDSSF